MSSDGAQSWASSYVRVSKKKLKPKKKCCNSKPRCKRCPVRLKKELRKQELKRKHRKDKK